MGWASALLACLAGCRFHFDPELAGDGRSPDDGTRDGVAAAIVLVQSTPAVEATNSNGVSVQLGAAPAPGDELVATISSNHNGRVTAVTGAATTWTLAVTAQNGPDERLYIYYGVATGTATMVQVSGDIQDNYTMNVSEWSGLATTLDATGMMAGGTGTTASSGVATSTFAHDLAIALETDELGHVPTGGPTNGYTQLAIANDHQLHVVAYRLADAAGAQSTTYTFPAGDEPWTGIIAAFAGD